MLASGCATYPSYTPWDHRDDEVAAEALPPPDLTLEVPGLSNCTSKLDRSMRLASTAPLTILVHGCYASAGKFYALASVLAQQGQQTICYSYDDRASLWDSSRGLIQAIRRLRAKGGFDDITVLGHSLGGLVSRKALIAERPDRLEAGGAKIRLVTVSSPLGGVEAAAHCGSIAIAIISLGFTVPICAAVSGAKWWQITSSSSFISEPGTLVDTVGSYIKVVTNEQGTCRRTDEDGDCIDSDEVFSVAEQYHPPVDQDRRVTNVEVAAGHVEIVGDDDRVPTKLLNVLQAQGVMAKRYSLDHPKVRRLLAELYGPPAAGGGVPRGR